MGKEDSINDYTQEEKTKKYEKVDFPFARTRNLPIIKGDKITKEPEKSKKLKEPICIIMKGNGECDIIEDVREGILNVNRKTGKGYQTVPIILPKSKMRSFPWGNEVIKGFIVDETEAIALTTDTRHDSVELARLVKALQTNYKLLDQIASGRMAWGKMIMYILIGFAILFGVLAWFKIDLLTAIGVQTPPVQQATQTIIVESKKATATAAKYLATTIMGL